MKNYLEHFMQVQHLSVADLSKKTKISVWRINLILKKESEPFLSEARKISKALEVDIDIVFPEKM